MISVFQCRHVCFNYRNLWQREGEKERERERQRGILFSKTTNIITEQLVDNIQEGYTPINAGHPVVTHAITTILHDQKSRKESSVQCTHASSK